MTYKSPKVLIVSFDGGVWSNLLPLAEGGIMPNLKRLLSSGAHTNLESTIPPVTPPAWTAFMTGCNPGKTGVFDFYEYNEGNYKPSLTTSKSIQVPTLWKILSDKGFKVGVVDVPINYPPQEVNGFIISGWERPTNKKIFTYPPELGNSLIEKLGDYPICLRTFDRQGTKDADFIDKLIDITKKVGDAALWLLETKESDFFMVHFQTTDIIQHGFWDQIATLDFTTSNPTICKIWEFYRCLDEYLGKLRAKLSDKGTFLLVSDHGFGPVKRRMAINVWLKENGYLKLKNNLNTQFQTKIKSTAIKMVNKVDALARLKNRIKTKNEEKLEQRVIVPRTLDDLIDYKESRAFGGIGTVFGTIQLNLIGREAEGIVPKQEADALKIEIMQKLANVKDPISGQAFIKKVCKKEEVFSGQAINKLPDLIIIPQDGFYIFSGTQEQELFHGAHPLSCGNHYSYGILLIDGNGLEASKFDLSSPKITDITPTIMDIFGLNTLPHMDGKSLLSRKQLLV